MLVLEYLAMVRSDMPYLCTETSRSNGMHVHQNDSSQAEEDLQNERASMLAPSRSVDSRTSSLLTLRAAGPALPPPDCESAFFTASAFRPGEHWTSRYRRAVSDSS